MVGLDILSVSFEALFFSDENSEEGLILLFFRVFLFFFLNAGWEFFPFFGRLPPFIPSTLEMVLFFFRERAPRVFLLHLSALPVLGVSLLRETPVFSVS